MFLLIILLSYLLGCASTIALLLYLYTRLALYSPAIINEQEQEQYQAVHPLPESERAKNSAVDAVNYLFQFLFQELKDSSRLRRYILHKLNTEFKELKNSRTGKILLQNILIQNFSIGKECPVFSDIQLERQERDERHLIKEFVANLDVDYKDGFSVSLDITVLFGQKCQLFIKVKHIHGRLRLEFRREPFCHWLCVFQDEPLIDFEVTSHFATVESPKIAQIITQQLRRAIKRKQTWPSYKIRYQPFFPTSKQSLPIEVLSPNGKNLIPGIFNITIKYCDRLSIPLGIFDKQKISSVTVFLTININEQMCSDYLYIKREQWPRKDIELIRNINKIIIKEVIYMDRTELLIEDIDPLPNSIEDTMAFKAALADKNVFLLQIHNQDVKTLKEANRLLKYKSVNLSNDGPNSTTTTTNGYDDKIPIVIGMPILHSVRVQSTTDSSNVIETEKQVGYSPTLSIRNDASASLAPSNVVRRTVSSTAVKFDKSVSSVSLTSTNLIGDDEQAQNINNNTDNSIKPQDANVIKKAKQPRYSANDITLSMMNVEILETFQARPTPSHKPESHIEFKDQFEFQVDSNQKFLNICLWCKAPLDSDVPNAGKKLILLGYATITLSEIVLDAHMSYKREAQMTLNFRSAYSPKPNINTALTDVDSKKRLELSSHKGYDDNLAHGFVTINIIHLPEIDVKLNSQEKKEQFLLNGPALHDIHKKIIADEKKRDQLKYINVINEQNDLPSRKPTDHIFEDKAFSVTTLCAYCSKKIWLKSGRQCRDCLITIHKKCEEKFSIGSICTHEPSQPKTNPISINSDDDLKNLVQIEINDTLPIITTDDIDANSIKSNDELVPILNNNRIAPAPAPAPAPPLPPPITTTQRFSTKAAAAFSALDSTARRSFRTLGNKNTNQTVHLTPNLQSTSELSKSAEALNNSLISSTKKSTVTNPSVLPTSSKIANAASSAYSKLRELKSKRSSTTSDINSIKKIPSSFDSTSNVNIPEADLRDIITKYLSDENSDITGLENLLHEGSIDTTSVYARAREVGPELFRELIPEERKQKLDKEISRLQQEIDLQCQIRDEMIRECENSSIDENEKRKLRAKVSNIDEKIQALGALTILYCSGLKHCYAQLKMKENTNNPSIQPINELSDADNNNCNIPRDDDDGNEE